MRRMLPTWGAVILCAALLGLGTWSQHRDEVHRQELACTLIAADERIINGLLALPGAKDPDLAPYVREYRDQLTELARARDRLVRGAC